MNPLERKINISKVGSLEKEIFECLRDRIANVDVTVGYGIPVDLYCGWRLNHKVESDRYNSCLKSPVVSNLWPR